MVALVPAFVPALVAATGALEAGTVDALAVPVESDVAGAVPGYSTLGVDPSVSVAPE